MPYDEHLAARVRPLVQQHGLVEEKLTFGGLSFMVRGHLAVCVSAHGGLLVRVTAPDRDALLDPPHVTPMAMAGRESRTWLQVAPAAVASDEALVAWVARGVAVVHGLPPK
ncbi:hypothetical protein NPS01_29350 [Nocardioides psychrotolerans]|uniref:TfoX N-terminal domain-containing protein n=1 Tax=Nocardioides psychrotolerans TaxID=1005945 RepID=A0A1I3DWJ7_9ACTN|nr:TfoX/Sxy family protein [Nocardioides psychrotolerans]GEP39272.1 hypothetical protein NPS01_29350 [Nocardioides psychrotolerans]SFH91106.1 TfoX N-terminal domain-containing protein [Nocardioides psychrotolerans]